MNELSINELIKEANEERVRITIEITPDGYGTVRQRIEIEPWEPYQPYCPYNYFVKEDKPNE